MCDLVSFTKSITEDTVKYMRLFFDENFAMYSILGTFEGYNVSIVPNEQDSGDIIYKIESDQKGTLKEFISTLNGVSISVYGTTYNIQVMNPIENILNIHLTKIIY